MFRLLLKKQNLFLCLILLAAIFLRFFKLGSITEGFHADEAAFGYNAYSILQTGKDEYGHFLPLILRSFDDYKGAVYAYLTIPFVKFFGLNEVAVRLPSAIFGVLFVWLAYLVVLKLTKEKELALFTSLLVAISPISVLLSRVQSDPLVSVFFVVFGFYLFLLWLEKGDLLLLVANCFFWILSFYTSPSPRASLPFFIIVVFAFYFRKIFNRQRILMAAFFSVVVLVDVFLTFGPAGSRFKQLSVFNTPQVILLLEEKIREDQNVSIPVVRFFHNKVVDYGVYLTDNFFQHLSFRFLFLEGGLPEREKIPNIGVLYLIELPFLFFGIFQILKQKLPWGYFTLLWIISVPISLAIASDETPNVHRFFLAILPIELIVSYGVISLSGVFSKRTILYRSFLILLVLLYVYGMASYLHQLFVHQPVHRPWHRGYAYKELNSLLANYYDRFRKIVITKSNSSPYIYILFFQKFDPKEYQVLGSPRDYNYTGFDKYYFVPFDCPFADDKISLEAVGREENVIYVNKGSCEDPKANARLLNTAKWGDNSPAFKLLEYVSTASARIKFNEKTY